MSHDPYDPSRNYYQPGVYDGYSAPAYPAGAIYFGAPEQSYGYGGSYGAAPTPVPSYDQHIRSHVGGAAARTQGVSTGISIGFKSTGTNDKGEEVGEIVNVNTGKVLDADYWRSLGSKQRCYFCKKPVLKTEIVEHREAVVGFLFDS